MLPNGTLIANLTADAHAWLDEFLALQRDEHFMLGTQFQIVIGPKEVIRQILPTGKDQVFLSEAESQRMLTEAQQASRSDVIFAPKLMSFFRTRCSISSYDRIAYIRDWKVERIEPGHQQIADPHIGTVRNGQGILVRGVALAADRIGLEVEFENSVVKQPIRTATVKLPMDGGRDVEIGLPEVDTQRLSTQLVMQPGRCAVFRGPLADGEREVVVFVHAQRLDPHAVGEPLEGK